MSQWSESKLPATDELSSLMDGELEASSVARACFRWRDDPEARSRWHAYHLIGDVLRSEDLASDGSHDAAFLAAFREHLAKEPVVLAPAPVSMPHALPPAAALPRRSWTTPIAVAAGFVAVAGVLVVTQLTGGMPGAQPETTLARSATALPALIVSAGSAPGAAGEPAPVVLNGQLIRDVRLDEYLAAHKKFGGSSVAGGPSGFLRNATADGTAR